MMTAELTTYKFYIENGGEFKLHIEADKEEIEELVRLYHHKYDKVDYFTFLDFLDENCIFYKEIEEETIHFVSNMVEYKRKFIAEYLGVELDKVKHEEGDLFSVMNKKFLCFELDGDDEKHKFAVIPQ